jgi:hypothetical protein
MLLSIDTVSAQYGYSNGGGGGGYGRNNQIVQTSGSEPDQPKEIPVEVTVGKIMENLKPQLNLDALQD